MTGYFHSTVAEVVRLVACPSADMPDTKSGGSEKDGDAGLARVRRADDRGRGRLPEAGCQGQARAQGQGGRAREAQGLNPKRVLGFNCQPETRFRF